MNAPAAMAPGAALVHVATLPVIERAQLQVLATALGWPGPKDVPAARARGTWGRNVRWARPRSRSTTLNGYALDLDALTLMEAHGLVEGFGESLRAEIQRTSSVPGWGQIHRWLGGLGLAPHVDRGRVALSVTPLGQAVARLRLETLRLWPPEHWPSHGNPLLELVERRDDVNLLSRALDWPSVEAIAEGRAYGRVRWKNPRRARFLLYGESSRWSRLVELGWATRRRGHLSSPSVGTRLTRWTPTPLGRAAARLLLLAVHLEGQLARRHRAREAG